MYCWWNEEFVYCAEGVIEWMYKNKEWMFDNELWWIEWNEYWRVSIVLVWMIWMNECWLCGCDWIVFESSNVCMSNEWDLSGV